MGKIPKWGGAKGYTRLTMMNILRYPTLPHGATIVHDTAFCDTAHSSWVSYVKGELNGFRLQREAYRRLYMSHPDLSILLDARLGHESLGVISAHIVWLLSQIIPWM